MVSLRTLSRRHAEVGAHRLPEDDHSRPLGSVHQTEVEEEEKDRQKLF